MKDLIERQDIIKELESWLKVEGYSEGELNIIKAVLYELQSLPSAQPERKNGHWEMVPDPYGFFDEIPVCSECGCTTEMRKTYKYCPTCGADMRGDE